MAGRIHTVAAWTMAGLMALGGGVGCESAPQSNRGSTNEIPRDVRGPVNHGHLGGSEVEDTTDRMLADIVASMDELDRTAEGETIIVLDRMENRTAYPAEDFDLFLYQLRRKLNQSGARYSITFVEDPQAAEGVRNRVLEEPLKDDYMSPGMRPHYALRGMVWALEEDRARYWDVSFSLLSLDPYAPVRNAIAWESATNYRFAR